MSRELCLSPDEIETLADDIAETAAHIDAVTHRLLTQVRTFDEAEGWTDTGCGPGASAGAEGVVGPGRVWGQVHEYGFSVERDADGLVTFRNPRGDVVPATGERGLRQAAHRERTRRLLAEAGVTIDASTNAPRWDGTPPDYGLCIEVLSDADRVDLTPSLAPST